MAGQTDSGSSDQAVVMDRCNYHPHNKMNSFYTANYDSVSATLWKLDAVALLSNLPESSVDLIVTSPPYFMGKEYDESKSVADFMLEHDRILPLAAKALKDGGSVCWQVGHHVDSGRLVPLDALVYMASLKIPDLILRNRIVWTF